MRHSQQRRIGHAGDGCVQHDVLYLLPTSQVQSEGCICGCVSMQRLHDLTSLLL